MSKIPEVVFKMRFYNKEQDKYVWDSCNSIDIFKNKRVILMSIPGAFTPKCTTFELPEYEMEYENFKNYNIDEVFCLSVNDAFVMNYWGKNLGIQKIKLIPDGNGEFTKKMNKLVQKFNLGFGYRSWRYTAIINDCVIEKSFDEDNMIDNSEEDPYEKTKPIHILNYLKSTTYQP